MSAHKAPHSCTFLRFCLERAMGFEPTTPTLARYAPLQLTCCHISCLPPLRLALPTHCPNSLEFCHRLSAMRRANGSVALDHTQ